VRVTNSMLTNNMIRNLAQNYQRLEKTQEVLASGKRIQKPSDDPVGIGYSMRYRSELVANEQYERNVNDGISWLEYTDNILNQAGNSLQRARELAVQGASDSNPLEARQAIAKEIDQILGHVLNLANSEFNGRYIFNGQKTDVKPFNTVNDALTKEIDQGKLNYEIGRDILMDVNLSGNEVFGAPGTGDGQKNVFQALVNLRDSLMANDTAAIGETVGQIDQRLDIVLEQRAEVGARMNRFDMAKTRITDQSYNLNVLLSTTEDADIAKTIIELKQQENVHKASLSTGARMIQQTLVDFIR
jgi:flagellar hook-associated protein 3 FlgL